MFLEEITGDIKPESDKLECKAVLNREDVVGWLKTIAGFANASGGDFYIGVEDKTNKLIGNAIHFTKMFCCKPMRCLKEVFKVRISFITG